MNRSIDRLIEIEPLSQDMARGESAERFTFLPGPPHPPPRHSFLIHRNNFSMLTEASLAALTESEIKAPVKSSIKVDYSSKLAF
ncbi:hypothetical protein F7725_012138 [Dissostichus mawsoni]|uniref:Uncharacterized protein n=1 Tax=Dissostichus mawsoni TaxID=36200 RepID=A0A7J5ZDX6_DISMA|nr:hypothetical protein F7725_012138 [Dissostichus mawsoni]